MGTLNTYTSMVSRMNATSLVDLTRVLGDATRWEDVEFFRLDFVADNFLIDEYPEIERIMTFYFARANELGSPDQEFFLMGPDGKWRGESVHVPQIFLGDRMHQSFDDQNEKHRKFIGWLVKLRKLF